MQQLEERNTYTPTDVPQVRGNCGLSLNSSKGRNSVPDLKTSSNNSDAALTGQFRTRTGLVSTCCKTEHLTKREHDCQLSLKLVLYFVPTAKAVGFREYNEIAFAAASVYKDFKEYGLSLVDSFSLVIAKKERADIFTTEHGLRDAGKDFGVRVSFLPKEIFKR